jgi:hypothetical protein
MGTVDHGESLSCLLLRNVLRPVKKVSDPDQIVHLQLLHLQL